MGPGIRPSMLTSLIAIICIVLAIAGGSSFLPAGMDDMSLNHEEHGEHEGRAAMSYAKFFVLVACFVVCNATVRIALDSP